MNTGYLFTEDKYRIAHFLAERAVSNLSIEDTQTLLEQYVTTFNEVLETLDKEKS